MHRPDLIGGRSEKDILELRRDPELAREITTQFVEKNAVILRKRGLPVTPGTLYLAHFAGPAGAVAILSVPENADAASLIASADATGRMTRDKIVGANPFLRDFTVADLKSWADRKMRGSGVPWSINWSKTLSGDPQYRRCAPPICHNLVLPIGEKSRARDVIGPEAASPNSRAQALP